MNCEDCGGELSKTYWTAVPPDNKTLCDACHTQHVRHCNGSPGVSVFGDMNALCDFDDEPTTLRDIKEALGNGLKPDITHIRTPLMVYGSRAGEYGSDKYERANFLRPTPGPAADFNRLRGYSRACVAHLMKMLDSMERHQSQDPHLEDVDGMRKAAYAPDDEAGVDFPASGLPHVAHAVASLNMAIAQAVDAGLLPADPGQPWKKPAADFSADSDIRSGLDLWNTFDDEPTSVNSEQPAATESSEHLRNWRRVRGCCETCGLKKLEHGSPCQKCGVK